MPTVLPISSTTLFQQPDGTFTAASTGAVGEVPTVVPTTDLVGMDDMDPNGAETTSDLQALTQDLYHVLLESYGANLDDPTRGIGIDNALSGSSIDVAKMPALIDRQFEQDDRVQQSSSTLTQGSAAGEFSLVTTVLPVGSVLPIQFSYSPATGLQLLRSA